MKRKLLNSAPCKEDSIFIKMNGDHEIEFAVMKKEPPTRSGKVTNATRIIIKERE